jgi:hypothetical protein
MLQKELDNPSLDATHLQMQGLDMPHGSIMATRDALHFVSPPVPKSSPILDNKLVVDHSSLLTMHQHLQTLTNEVIAFLQATLNRTPDQLEYRLLLSRWDTCTALLTHLVARAAHSPGDFSQPLMALQLAHAQVEYYLRYPRSDVSRKFYFMADPHRAPFEPVAHFARMLDLATRLLPHSSSLLPVFTTSMGPLSALWIIATRAPSVCTEIRKRAVRVMLSYPRREGFWDGMVAGQVAQEVLKLEQESAREELGGAGMEGRDLIVPDDLRIVVVALKYDEVDNRRASVEHRSKRDMALDRRGRMQYLTW